MPKHACRTDKNHAAIRSALRKRGFVVFDTFRAGRGYPDMHVSKDGLALLVEIKSDGEWLNENEQAFHDKWEGPLIIAYYIEDVLLWFGENGVLPDPLERLCDGNCRAK